MNRNIILLAVIGSLFLLKPSDAKEGLRAEDFLLTIKPVGVVSARRGVMLDVDVKYLGEGSFDVYPLHNLFLRITFEAPPEWQAEAIKPKAFFSGVPPHFVTLKKSNSLSTTMFLNHYLSVILPGEVVLNAKMRISSAVGKGAVVLKTQVPLTIINEDDSSLQRYVRDLWNKIKREKDFTKKPDLYLQLLLVSSRDVMDVLLFGLTDKDAAYHSQIVNNIVRFADKYKQQEKVVGYLLKNGSRTDEGLFMEREGKRISFSDEEWRQFRFAKPPWIKLYAIKYRPVTRHYTEKDKLKDILSVEKEIDEMKQICEEVKESLKGENAGV